MNSRSSLFQPPKGATEAADSIDTPSCLCYTEKDYGGMTMGKITWKPGTLEAPLPPVLVTCGNREKANILTIAWTGIVNSEPPMTYISVRPGRASYPLIRQSGEFILHLPTSRMARLADSCGIYTGAKVNKFEKFHIQTEEASSVACPLLCEAPIALECKVTQVIPLGSHDLFLAKILAVDVDENLIDETGRLRIEKADLLAYAHGSYFTLGKKIGNMGFSVRKKTPGRSGGGAGPARASR